MQWLGGDHDQISISYSRVNDFSQKLAGVRIVTFALKALRTLAIST